MELACTRCGQVCSEPGAKFCPSCGGRLEFRPASGAPAPPPAPAPQAAPPPSLAPELAGARCAIHPDVPANDLCSRCGNFACAACVKLDASGRPHCASCAQRVHLGSWDVPWERRAELGFFKAYWETAKAAAFEPVKTFENLQPGGTWWDSMSYAMVSYALSIAGTLLLYAGIFGFAAIFASKEIMKEASPAIAAAIVVGVLLAVAISVPIGAIMRAYIGSGIDHLMLMLFGGGKGGFNATFRGYCYAMSPAMFGLIPGCGIYIWEIWRIVCCILAYKSAHKMPGTRAAAAVLTPIALCCGGYFVLIFGAQMFAAANR